MIFSAGTMIWNALLIARKVSSNMNLFFFLSRISLMFWVCNPTPSFSLMLMDIPVLQKERVLEYKVPDKDYIIKAKVS